MRQECVTDSPTVELRSAPVAVRSAAATCGVVRALYESARSGTAVALPPFPRKKKPSIVQEFGPPTASPKPSILSLPPANPRDEQRPVR